LTRPALPGSVLGVLGGGQLGRMFAIAARRMGYRVHVLAPEDDTPTGQVADVEVRAPYEDLAAVEAFARRAAVVTFEFENVPLAAAEASARHAPVRPGGNVLHTTQDRLREKSFLAAAGIATTTFAAASSAAEAAAAIAVTGAPAVLKTSAWGYDGKGQAVVRSPEEAATAWASVDGEETIVEGFVDFETELSVVAARGVDGSVALYGPMRNDHRDHILDVSVFPAGIPPRTAADALEIARTVVERLDVIGVLCVEFFLTRDGRLLVNELAPRPHNSGHLTIDSHVTCQFEQQVRAVCGLPLGDPSSRCPAAMANLLGDLWSAGEPDWVRVCGQSDVKLHLYGKSEARPGRKMGHLTALGETPADARRRAVEARGLLSFAGRAS
jgi:5-(carboxyamino)imidazole ribonucleotide synthase